MKINKRVKDEFDYYLAHQDEFVEKYNGKVLVLKNHEVVDTFDDYETAYFESVKKYGYGTFILQRCSPGDGDYTIKFNSTRVSFA